MALLTTSLNTGSKTLTEIYDSVANAYNYQTTIPDPNDINQTIANPETKAQHYRRRYKEWAQDKHEAGLINPAVDTAKTTALNNKGTLT